MVPPPTLSGAEAEGDAAASAGFGCAETGAAGHTETGEGSSSLSGSSGFPWRSGPAQLGAGPAQLGAGPACVPVCASSAVGSPELGGACFGKGAEWSPKLCFPVPCGRLAMVWALSPISFYSRKLGTAGQKLGGAAVLCHIRHDPVDPGGPFTLTSANVGKCQTVLCRNGKPLPLSRSYVMSCEEELQRIKRHKAIVTEVRAVFLRLWGDWEEAAELAGEHLPRRSVDAKADPRFQIRIHSIRVDSCRIQNRAQSPLHVRAGQSPHPILGAPTGGSDLAASPRQGRAVTPSHPRGTHRGLGPGGLSASGPGGHPVSSSGHPQGAPTWRPLHVRAGRSPHLILGAPTGGSGLAASPHQAELSSWLLFRAPAGGSGPAASPSMGSLRVGHD